MSQTNEILLSIGSHPHVARATQANQTLTKIHFDGNAALGEEVHTYVTPEGGATITHDVPLRPNGAGERTPHAPITLPGNREVGSTCQVEFNPLDQSVMRASD